MRKGIKNVFEAWKDDSDKLKRRAFDLDKAATEKFAIEHLAKD